MSHTHSCEIAQTYSCVCPCGGARHGAVLIRGITSTNPAAQNAAYGRAEPKRWSRLDSTARGATVDSTVADRQPVLTGVISELVLVMIEGVRENRQLAAIEKLAGRISDKIGDEFERRLGAGGSDRRNNNHLWCVVIATVCRVYDDAAAFLGESVDDLVDEVMTQLEEEVSTARGEQTRRATSTSTSPPSSPHSN